VATYRWVYHGDQTLYDVGILSDGTLHNPRGYPDDIVRTAVVAAEERRRQRRSDAAKKAAQTRHRRIEKRVYSIARKILEGQEIGPSQHCVICGRGLDGHESIERGIGSDCWQDVLRLLTPAAGTAGAQPANT
jgi:hypothetical protein